MLSLEQKMSMAQTAHSQFEQAYQLVVAINGPLARNEAWDVARELLREGVDQRHLAEQVQPLRMRLSELEQRLTPGLTTVKQQISAKGEKAVELLIRNINEPELTKQELILPVSLVERGSVRKIKTETT